MKEDPSFRAPLAVAQEVPVTANRVRHPVRAPAQERSLQLLNKTALMAERGMQITSYFRASEQAFSARLILSVGGTSLPAATEREQ